MKVHIIACGTLKTISENGLAFRRLLEVGGETRPADLAKQIDLSP